jgi:hypothetical protein
MAEPTGQDAWREHAIGLPTALTRYFDIGGVLLFTVFADVDGDEESCICAIASVVPGVNTSDLRALGSRRVDDQAFFGDWRDTSTGDLLLRGTYTTEDGRTLTNPRLRDLDDVVIDYGGGEIPDTGAGGQFAYAFSWTPYGLQERPSKIQDLFDAVTDFILPPTLDHEIRDWSSPRLPEVSRYFEAGAEWWGVFLFTIYVPATRQLTVIAGSTTD